MNRVFISTWFNDSNHIRNPIVEYLDTQPPLNEGDPRITCNMFYADADNNGIPDKARVLVVVQNCENYVTQISALTGVTMLPAYRLTKPISEIPANVKNAVKTKLTNWGMPLSILSGAVTYGDVIHLAMQHFSITNSVDFFNQFDADFE